MLSYELPSELIAKRPVEPRDACRLLVLNRASGAVSHQVFRDLPAFLRSGDCLVLNDTKVLPARLFGKRPGTGGKVELLLLQKEGDSLYRCLGRPGKGLKPGAKILFNHGSIQGEVLSSQGNVRLVQFSGEVSDEVLFALGEIPLPPYIDRPVVPEDAQWYQTIYARRPGAVAAPTAGLHFTQELLQKIQAMGVRVAFVTLHVGWGTFKPVAEEELAGGRLHEEWFRLPTETAQAINGTKANGGRVIAVGTTVVRVLETCTWANFQDKAAIGRWGSKTLRSANVAGSSFSLKQYRSEREVERRPSLGAGRVSENPDPERGLGKYGMTNLFIRPPYDFKVVDAMITNFHLPGTSLLLLVAALAGEKQILKAYQEAIRERYRFYSYGDAMLIL